MSFKCIIGIHTWDGCKCSKCGKTRDEQHDRTEDCEINSKCGKIIENSKLPQQLYIPAINMPSRGIVHAPVNDAGNMAIPAFDSESKIVNWLENGGHELIWPIDNQRRYPGSQLVIFETTPEMLRNQFPSIDGCKRVVHLNPRIGISPDDLTINL